jgi:hypothetical protein
MQNIIFETVNKDWEIDVWIGSHQYFQQVAKQSKQAVRILHWTTNELERQQILQMPNDTLCMSLMNTMKNNVLHTFYLN